jgi:protein-tyrosine phosphatase
MIIKRVKGWLQGSGPGEPATGPDAGASTRVLMVCMGNICRSPTAEGVLRAKLRQAGLHGPVLVDSAGTHGYHTGEPPDPRAIRHAAQRGYDIAALQARPVAPDDYARFNWLLAMDEANLAWLQRRRPPQAGAQVALMMSFARRHPGLVEVPDPYYGGPAGFDHVLDLLEDACDGFVAHLARGEGPAEGAGAGRAPGKA